MMPVRMMIRRLVKTYCVVHQNRNGRITRMNSAIRAITTTTQVAMSRSPRRTRSSADPARKRQTDDDQKPDDRPDQRLPRRAQFELHLLFVAKEVFFG